MTKIRNLDPIKIENILIAGEIMWFEAHDTNPEMVDKIWVLLAEAAQTQKTLKADRPNGYGSGWPEYVMTANEIVAIQNERATLAREAEKLGVSPDQLLHQIGTTTRAGASAQALARYVEVTQWLRLIKSKRSDQKALRMRLLLALAGGLSCRKAADSDRFSALGITTKQGIEYFKERALDNIEIGLRAVLQRGEKNLTEMAKAS